MDGWITIGTKLDRKGLERDLKSAEKDLKNYQKESEQLTKQKVKYEADLNEYEREIAEYDKLIAKAGEYERKVEQLKSQGYSGVAKLIPMQTELAEINAQLDAQTPKIDQTHMKYEQTKQDLVEINKKIQDNVRAQSNVTNEVERTSQKLRGMNIKQNITEELGKTSNKMTGILSKVARWALAIFSIRSIYSTLSSASATLAQYNEQYAANLQYIRFALAQMLAPVLEYIVRLMYTILQYINAIAQAWFGVNLFANASADAFTKAKSSTGGIAKNAEKTRKELQQTNFDEMNVLQDTTSSTSGAGGGGVVAPTMDLSKLGDGELPGWLNWIKDHKDEILDFLKTVALLIAGIKIFQLVKGVGELFGGISAIKALGITGIILGVVMAIASLIEYIKDPNWKNFGGIIIGIGVALAGLAAVIGSFPLAVAAAAVVIVGIVVKNWDKIKGLLERAHDFINNMADNIENFLTEKTDDIYERFGIKGVAFIEAIKFWIRIIKEIIGGLITHIITMFEDLYGGARTILDGIIMIFKGDFKGGIEKVGEGIKQFFRGVWENIWYTFTWFWSAIIRAFNGGGEIFQGFKDGIVNVIKSLINVLISGINWAIAQPLNRLNGVLNTIKNIQILGAKPFDGFYGWNPIPVPQIPRLAKGTILNNPGKGVPVAGGRAIAGEAGREAYLPLSDKQLLEELGSTIGKYITINANIINKMNSRVISREMQVVKAEQNFAYNT